MHLHKVENRKRLQSAFHPFPGRTTTALKVADWLNGGGEVPFPENNGTWQALVLTAHECWFYSDTGQSAVKVDMPAAIGSGGDLAIGAMLAGAGPAKAVELAMKRDPFTGGPVRAMKTGCC